MAHDVEARSTGNSALVIGLIAVVLAIALAAFLFMRPNNPASTTVVDADAPPSTTTVIEAPDVSVSPGTSTSPNVSNGGTTAGTTSSTSSTTTTTTTGSGSDSGSTSGQ